MKAASSHPVDRMFRAFSDPTRLRILNLLLQGELCVCDIVSTLRIPQPTISRHLAYLRESHLVESRRDGLWMHYKLAAPQSTFHKKLLDCLACCFQDVPQLSKDSTRLNKTRCC
jgi:ArsR family transcriptional regulator